MSLRNTVHLTLKEFSPDLPADDESLFDTGVLDSFGLADFVLHMEESTGVKVPDSELSPRRFETVDKIVAYFETRMKG